MKQNKEIYILLTHTGTLLSRAIQYCTGEPLSHVSIAFDSELSEVYSFGRKCQWNPIQGGFVKENLRGPLFRHSPCAIYRLKVDEEAYMRIRIQIDHFIQHENDYHYNFLGMFAAFFEYNWERKNYYFCSQFVASVLQNANVHILEKSPALTAPGDFHYAGLELVYKGKLRHYIGSLQSICPTIETFQTA